MWPRISPEALKCALHFSPESFHEVCPGKDDGESAACLEEPIKAVKAASGAAAAS